MFYSSSVGKFFGSGVLAMGRSGYRKRQYFFPASASFADSNLPVGMEQLLKGSGPPKYLEIGPKFGLKEHYDRKGDWDFYFYGKILV